MFNTMATPIQEKYLLEKYGTSDGAVSTTRFKRQFFICIGLGRHISRSGVT